MTSSSVEKLQEIYKSLCDASVKKVVLVGERGVGKTWMAKKSSEHAIRKGVFDISLWFFLCRKYDDQALSESVARQLSLLPNSEEWEIEDDSNESKEKREKEEDDSDEAKKKEKEEWEKMNNKIHETLSGKKVLLILDDEGSKIKEEEFRPQMEFLFRTPSKVLITTTNDANTGILDGLKIEVQPLRTEESLSLLRDRIGTAFNQVPGFENLAYAFVEKSRNVPREIITIAKALSYFGKNDSGMRTLESALEEASETENYNVLRLLCSGYNLLPVGVLIDCCWSGTHFFRDCGSVHYNELITYWILEGYLGQVNSIEKAYEKGHHVLMELIDCQILKTLESGFVNRPVLDLDDCHQCGFGGTASLGLATLLGWKGLGRITPKDGVIKTLCKGSKAQNFSTLLLDGNQYGGEVLVNVLENQKKLQFLALFNPTLKSLPPPLSKMTELSVLVLRGCNFVKDINVPLDLQKLTALEISGANSLKIIPADFFKNMTQLQSLNLSELQVTSLPSSLYKLSELRWLILRKCCCLEKLEALAKLTNLVVLDLSDATSLKTISDKTFSRNQKLQTVNLSGTKIKNLPLLTNLGELTHFSLSHCTNLDRLRSVTSLTSLRVLDISGATKFKEFHNPSLENLSRLEILDLSETPLDYLPSNLGNPHSLYLKSCLGLKQLSCIKGLKDLKLLDLSGSTGLNGIANEFFKDLTCLQVLNLSETNLHEVPSLSNLHNLRQLLLSRCLSLEKLPDLSSLEKLEVLDASESCTLTKIQDESFEHMSRLQKLDLSATKIKCLPSLSDPSNLRHLVLKKCTDLKVLPPLKSLSKLEELNLCGVGFETGADFVKDMSNLQILDLSKTDVKQLPSMSKLKNLYHLSLEGCKSLKTVPNLEALTKLEVMDLSGTRVTHLPNLSNFSNLRELRLRGCASLEEFQRLCMPDLLKGTVKELPYAISELTHLEMFDPPNMKNIGGAGPKELNQHSWIISNWPAEGLIDGGKRGMSVNSNQFLEFLEENPLTTSFQKYHFLVHPTEAHNINGYIYSYRDELLVREIYFGKLALPMERERSLEIRGFSSFPKGIEDVLRHAEFIFLIDSPFIKCISDLGTDNIKSMKACWFERCTKMECVIHVEEMEEFGDSLEIMWVSHAISLKNIYSGNLQGSIFKNLKCFYLDYCPKISNVFPSSQQLENLEVVEIKFCDKMETLFENESATLPKLRTLHLWALPSLKRVGCVAAALRSLRVGECPMLVNVISSSQLPQDLEILHIKFCDQLETVIENSASTNHPLRKLHTLHMWELPKLKSIGAELLPLQDCNIRECPRLEGLS
ncbi:hypothetical protein LguiB_005060 [Lonicera macranthoides]